MNTGSSLPEPYGQGTRGQQNQLWVSASWGAPSVETVDAGQAKLSATPLDAQVSDQEQFEMTLNLSFLRIGDKQCFVEFCSEEKVSHSHFSFSFLLIIAIENIVIPTQSFIMLLNSQRPIAGQYCLH